MNKKEMIKLIEKFVSKKDTSIALANEIEVALDNLYPDDDYIQDVVLMLACYRPGGGDFLYDEDILIEKLKKVLEVRLK